MVSQGLGNNLAYVSNLAKHYLNQLLIFVLRYLHMWVTCSIFLKKNLIILNIVVYNLPPFGKS